MFKKRSPIKPVDRALDEVKQQIETLERQLREAATPAGTAKPQPVESVKKFVKEMLTPPAKRPARSPYRATPLVDTNPMEELEVDPIPFATKPEPDLFNPGAATVRQATPTGVASKLGDFLAANSARSPKPTLKRIQRQNRHSFFMWLGLSLVALWLIIVVVR